MSTILEQIIALASPHACVGCGAIGTIICTSCADSLEYPDRCFACKRPSLGGLTCSKCTQKTPITLNCVVTEHAGLGKSLVHSAKYSSKREAADAMGRLLSAKLPQLGSEVIAVPVPTTNSHVRLRGFDQSVRITRGIVNRTGCTYKPLLHRVSKHHQVGASRTDRIAHMRQGFRATKQVDLNGMTVVLVDDVVTTGATMESAARAIKYLGAKNIIAAYFARAE